MWEVSGVATCIAKYMALFYGVKSTVIVRERFDRRQFVHDPLVEGIRVKGSIPRYALFCLYLASRFDIIHVHSWTKILPYLRWVSQAPVVFTAHNITNTKTWGEERKRLSHADAVTVATPNLLDGAPTNARYFPNPIDTDLFNARATPRIKGAVTCEYGADEEAEALAVRYSVPLAVMPRDVPYALMPQALSGFEYYIDVKRSRSSLAPGIIHEMSKTAYEALACGTKVIDWGGNLHSALPEEHRPEVAVRNYYELYRTLLEERRDEKADREGFWAEQLI